MRRLLAAAAVLVLAAACRPAPPAGPADGVDVLQYDVSLRLDPATLAVDGRARLTLRRPSALERLPLAFGLEPRGVTVDGRSAGWEWDGERLVVQLPGGPAEAVVEVAYAGVPPVGLYAGTVRGRRVVYADGWPDRVAGWLPGVHHPSDPARLALDVAVPAGWEVVATGRPAGVDSAGGEHRYRWRLDGEAPTYAFALAAADFDRHALGDSAAVYRLAGASAPDALRRTPAMLRYFAALLGPYPYARYDAAEVPLGFAGMENAGTVFLRSALFDDGPELERVQAHELAHQWFGNAVPPAAWRDLWLSEGMATYLTTLFYEHADGPDAARRLRVEVAALDALRRRSHTALAPDAVDDPAAALTWVPYDKGACVLHLLRRTVGDEAFFATLRTLYAARAPLSTEAFRRALEDASGRSLADVFDAWVYADGLPRLVARWDASARRLAWRVEGDAGTLRGVPVHLLVRQGNRTEHPTVDAASLDLPGPARPSIHPVGVMLDVVWE